MSKKMKELQKLSAAELTQRVSELGETIFKTKFQKTTGQLTNTAAGAKLRKELARIKTLQTQSARKN